MIQTLVPMSRFEYSQTLHDLLGIAVDTSPVLPDDWAGGEGFDNAAETLFISSIYIAELPELSELDRRKLSRPPMVIN